MRDFTRLNKLIDIAAEKRRVFLASIATEGDRRARWPHCDYQAREEYTIAMQAAQDELQWFINGESDETAYT